MNKLVIDARMIHATGIGTYLQNLIPLICKDFSVILLGNVSDLSRFYQHNNLQVIGFNSPIYSISEQALLPVKIPTCDIFWSPHYNAPILPIKASKRIVTIHDVYHLAFYKTLNHSQKLYASFVLRQAVKNADQLITVSSFSKSEIIKYLHVNESKIGIIHIGVDLNLFKPIHDANLLEKATKKYALPKKFLLFVGNVKPHKNLKTLLEAFHQLPAMLKEEYHLVIVGKKDGFITGDNSIVDQLEKNNELKSKVIFTGFVESNDLPLLYSMASLYIFPSLYEGFGLPPLEAMACGCPTIVSNAASIPEICGSSTLYFNPNDPYELAQQIIKVLTHMDSKVQLIQSGLQHVQSFKWKKSADAHLNIFLK